MALASSGSISFAEIAAEFGGTAPHSLSEYYPLVGQGIAGLPSSGTFNFSHFHGKDKDMNNPDWVRNPSGTYQLTGGSTGNAWHANYQGNNNWINKFNAFGTVRWNSNSWTSGNTRYTATGAVGGGNPVYRDLYQDVWTVASISG
jgi:hypothetical protein